jgi:hypothetical protein
MQLLASELAVTGAFRPYVDQSPEANALTVYFRPEPDYSKRLTDHVTLYLSLETNEIVGCRIKGIRELLEDLPNFVRVTHEGVELKVIFWSFRGCAKDEGERQTFNELAKKAGGMMLAAK